MNCELVNVTAKAKNGEISKMESVFIRGSHIRFFLLPDMLKHAKVFDKCRIIAADKQRERKQKKK